MAESSSLFIVFVYLFPLLFHLLTAASHSVPWCHEDERSALMQLKQSLKEGPEYCSKLYDSWGDDKKLESWQLEGGQEGSNCCTWSGVQCDGRTNHVIGLDLRKACLYGSINSSSSLFRLSHLENLDLSLNNFNFSPIPPAIGNLWRLTMLDLSANVFTGPIPSQLGSLIYLEYLDLSLNRFHGPVPSSISHLSNLWYLNVYGNNLSGNLNLGMFSGLQGLMALVLSFNDFTLLPEPNASERQIPEWFSGFVSVRSLNLSYNSLTGFPQHPVFLNWTRLRSLDVRSNQLQGPLPAVPHASIQFYFVSNNRLSGTISPVICNMNNIQLLDLAKNNFSSVIPRCLSNLSSTLTVLSLHDNNFYGGIPQLSKGTCSLRMIDFSSNLLEGPLPRSLANCTELEFLNMGNNMIRDIFPSWLGSLANLKILDLSRNKLVGLLPSNYFQYWKAMRVLNTGGSSYIGYSWNVPQSPFMSSFVSVKGSIPRVKQFNTFDNSSYKGNAGLCGEPLSKKCAGPDNVAPPAPAAGDDYEGSNTLFDDFDWKIILMGFASGLVIGVVLGQGISIRGDNLFVRKFGRRYRRRHA
ncbi:hypothetical protein CRG98_040987 [Punica granatum]|uniref:Leucine-rich repeat-containing N-terminal plant-type domain-containing protein n=1 Tax=Punica granatum TaxID=22663 RepID=A0A2I0I3J3_PUNGR|nr:hypothetical protein CRG98_040987 [Punica granatum]